MEKLNRSEKSMNRFFTRSMLILVIVSLMVPTIFVFYSTQFPEKIRVGVMLTHDDLVEEGEIAKNGLNDFHDIFSAKVVDTRFDESEVRIRNGSYLTDDYFNNKFAEDIRNNHNVDIVLIITDKLINNWMGNGYARWGQADTKSGVALFTLSSVYRNPNQTEDYIVSVSRHEILHLLGYGHPNVSRKCLMRYASTETELCQEYQLVLPYYASLWTIGMGHDPGGAAFLIRVSFLLFFSPLFVAAVITSQVSFKKYMYKKNKINQNPLVLALGGLYITTLLATAFIMPLYPQIAVMSILVFVYLIMESLYYELKYKPQQSNGINKNSND
jgi:hypothetical protein